MERSHYCFDKLSGSHHRGQVKSCCQSSVLSLVRVNWLVSLALIYWSFTIITIIIVVVVVVFTIRL